MGGYFGVKINVSFLYLGVHLRSAKFLTCLLSLILRNIFFQFGQKKFFVKLLRPIVNVNGYFLTFFDVVGTLKIIKNI
jgi:hypothetical protein